jgi:hypothetical protein
MDRRRRSPIVCVSPPACVTANVNVSHVFSGGTLIAKGGGGGGAIAGGGTVWLQAAAAAARRAVVACTFRRAD